jgi:hypothetical protein
MPPPPEGELKFQMQGKTWMKGKMHFVIGNMCDRLDRVENVVKKPVQAPKT